MGKPAPEAGRSRRRAVATLFVTLLLVGGLGLVGLGVEDHLSPTSLAVDGTASERGEALSRRYFGDSSPFAVMLSGPAGAIDRTGPRLALELRRRLGATVISPWDHTAASAKLPHPPADVPARARSRAVLLLDFHLGLAQAMRHQVPALDRLLAERVHPPLVAAESGYAAISRSLQTESLSAAERAELIAVPLLLIVLFFVFRSLVAMAIPLLFGAATVFAGRGMIVLLTSFMPIDVLSLVVCTMMGLALGVDYSLLIVSRFREELAAGRSPAEAAAATRLSAGRTTAVAGTTLFASIFLSAFLQPGELLVSLAATLAVVSAIAVIISSAVLPSLLVLLGPRINSGRIGRSEPQPGGGVAAAAAAALRRPALAAGAIALVLALLAVPALALDVGSPGADELSSGSKARLDTEAIARSAGPGWVAPFTFTVASESGPITSRSRLAELVRLQRRLEDLPGARKVIGPAAAAAAARPLRSLGSRLDPRGSSTAARLAGFGGRLRKAFATVRRFRRGLAEAAGGSGLLAQGSGRAGEGGELLANGLDRASRGGARAAAALSRLAGGSGRLADGQRRAAATAYSLSLGLHTVTPTLAAQGLRRARRLAASLQAAARSEPSLRAAAHEGAVLSAVLAQQGEELQRLRYLATNLKRGLGRLDSGGRRLHGGTVRVAAGAEGFGGGLRRLGAGAERLAGGLDRLHGGAQALRDGLATGYHRGYRLQLALRRAGLGISRLATPLGHDLSRLQRLSPEFFSSGFLGLAAIDGSLPLRRSLAAEVINVTRGGTAARYLVIPSSGFNSAASRRLGARLGSIAADVDAQRGLRAGLGGGAAVLNDYGSATKARLPLVVGAIVAITFLLLVVLLRAPMLAALAVMLNLLSVGAAVGVVTLACRIPAGYPLGGHRYIDTVGGAAIFGVTFGLSIDYAVFLLARMRERHDEISERSGAPVSADLHADSIAFGIRKTGSVITGAAVIMAAVFASFAAAPVATVSQMGLGLAVAVLLDATVVRIVLLPALMLLIGERIWHTPAWLDRLIPRIALGDSPEPAPEAGT